MSKVSKPKRVKCYGCGNPIHIDNFAGIGRTKRGKVVYSCDALPCLLKISDLIPVDDEPK